MILLYYSKYLIVVVVYFFMNCKVNIFIVVIVNNSKWL